MQRHLQGLTPMRIVDQLPPIATASSADPLRVSQILADVRARGDAAVREWTSRLDGAQLDDLTVPPEVLEAAWHDLTPAEQQALDHAARNITAFAAAQRKHLTEFTIEIEPGVVAGQRVLPIDRVACYVPGGRYPLPSTVLMTVLIAKVAGVPEIAVFTPPSKGGLPDRYILAAAWRAGATTVHPIGGVQAVAAAAYGTESVRPVHLIVGPGNAWVTEAKRQVYGQVGIDALAGPSEVMVLADRSADVQRIAADLLAQAEHDPDAQAIAVTDDPTVADAISQAVTEALERLPTRAVAARSIADHGCILVVPDRAAMAAVANQRAPEHLEIHVEDAEGLARACTAYGGLFIGGDAAEVLGDYCTGPSHVLPTGGAGHYTGGLSVYTFVKIVSTQAALPGAAAGLARTAATLARIEGLEAHARAAEHRDPNRIRT